MRKTLDIAEKAFKKSDEVVGLKTGLRDFDKKIGGLHKSDLVIIAGRPSMGKPLLPQILHQIFPIKMKVLKLKKCVVFFIRNVF